MSCLDDANDTLGGNMKTTVLKLVAVLAALLMLAAACGSDSSDDAAETATNDAVESTSNDTADAEEAAEPADSCPENRGVTDTSIKFGSSQPLTGNLAALGADATFALELTVERINSGGGINGRMLEIVVQDDEYNPERTTANSQFFIDREEVFGIWGSIGSAPLVAAIPLHDEAGVLTLFPWAQDLSLYDVDAHPLFFSVNPSAYAQTLAFSDYLINESIDANPKVGLFTINSVDGEQTVQGFKDGLAGEFLAAEQTYERDTTTVAPQVIAFQEAGVTDVYVGSGDATFAQFLQEADQLGFEARIWGSTGTITQNSIELAGDLAEGSYGVGVQESADAVDQPGVKAYRDAMMAAGAEDAQLGTASLLAYAGGLALEEGLRRAGDCLTTESFVEAMESIDGFETGGIMPPLSFSADNHLGNNGVVIFQVQDAAWVRIS